MNEEIISAEVMITVYLEKFIVPEIKPNIPIFIDTASFPLDFMNGAKLSFPAQSFSDEISLTMKLPTFALVNNEKREISYYGAIIDAIIFEVVIDNEVISPYYFNEPVEISIPFNQTKMSGLGIDPLDIRLFHVNEAGTFEAEGISDINVDMANALFTAKVDHFSTFATASKYSGPTLLGDFDYNLNVDFYDFVQLIAYWNNGNINGDIVGEPDGVNNAGFPPWYTNTYLYTPDGTIDFEDMTVFALMYNWYQSQKAEKSEKPIYVAKETPSRGKLDVNWQEADYKVGDTFTITLNPKNISDFLGAEVALAFDSTILQVKNVTSGYVSNDNDVTTPVKFKTSGGILTAFTVVLGNVREGLSLAGETIFEIEFEVIGEGSFSIELSSIDMRNFRNNSIVCECDNTLITGKIAHEKETLTLVFGLSPNYPNPFNMSTSIGYTMDKQGELYIVIYNALGQHIKTLVNGNQKAGKYSIVWNGTDDEGGEVTSGIYIVNMRHGRSYDTKQILLMK